MREKYLPIGSVVLLKGGKKRAMITGFCSVAQENQEKIYDYSGCVYPEGYLSSNQVCLFDHEQIEQIYFVGYEDEEEAIFKEKLNKIVTEQKPVIIALFFPPFSKTTLPIGKYFPLIFKHPFHFPCFVNLFLSFLE